MHAYKKKKKCGDTILKLRNTALQLSCVHNAAIYERASATGFVSASGVSYARE